MTLLITLHALVTLALIVIILMQKRNTGALGGLAGQSNPSRMMTPRASNNPLAKVTTWLAAVFIGLSLLLAYLSKAQQVDPTEALSRAVQATSVPVETTPVLPGPGSASSSSVPAAPLTPAVETPSSVAPASQLPAPEPKAPATQEKTDAKPASPQSSAP